ncbi:uncharacterized protein V1518DRAFT_404607 [Limtongia smithiae]|uniref:uncharacterized protein n=1 Tax=Limtongia smithiae TaxID=1125753 RepID=UPI0034CD7420
MYHHVGQRTLLGDLTEPEHSPNPSHRDKCRYKKQVCGNRAQLACALTRPRLSDHLRTALANRDGTSVTNCQDELSTSRICSLAQVHLLSHREPPFARRRRRLPTGRKPAVSFLFCLLGSCGHGIVGGALHGSKRDEPKDEDLSNARLSAGADGTYRYPEPNNATVN